ncbi:hypothetical protein DSM3645_03958 [Blastopirellula marina DSM 3645]|uniref:Uncharacterized protein n=1 Tax=Blastopirellula marina DSM 3645 TaxID=314230 RepID=A3ZV63_9BACT|nr:hypothetical protein DSM3645_03958 [Blastopirellula marina DSM 3645]
MAPLGDHALDQDDRRQSSLGRFDRHRRRRRRRQRPRRSPAKAGRLCE